MPNLHTGGSPMKEKQRPLYASLWLLAAFVLWTAALCLIDRQPIGPQGSVVGFAALNGWFHNLIGVHQSLYVLTDWLGLIPAFFCAGFTLLGLAQWIRRRHFLQIDFSLLVLGGFYLAVLAAYICFELFVINYRPVLIDGIPEASYPSSTTMLALCVMPTAALQLNGRIRCRPLRCVVSVCILAFTVFMVLGRLLSGVHWLSDIIGGILLSGSLVSLYVFFSRLK